MGDLTTQQSGQKSPGVEAREMGQHLSSAPVQLCGLGLVPGPLSPYLKNEAPYWIITKFPFTSQVLQSILFIYLF